MRRHDPRERPDRQVEFLVAPAPDETEDEPAEFAVGTHEMEKVDRIDDDELVEIVHDLKNPLSTIGLEMSLLDDKLTYLASPDVRATMLRIRRNLAFLDRLVHGILDTDALEGGSFSLRRRPVELCALLLQVVERSVSSRDRTRIYLEAPSRLTVSVDGVRIERVVANLVQNALKYSHEGSGVVVRLERTPTNVRVTVIDSGPGISREETGRIFERYQRGAHGHRHDGCGLGLYIARRIVEAHGGTIGVESLPNIGSRFYFELPLV